MKGAYLPALPGPFESSQPAYETNQSNLYVKNLPDIGLDEGSLAQLFSRYGVVESCRIVKHAKAGAGSYGFVKMQTNAQAQEAIREMNGMDTGAGLLEVRVSDAGPPHAGRHQTPCDNVYVRNLPSTWTEQELRDLFSAFGIVQECRMLHRGDDSRGAGALVRLSTTEAAAQAISTLNNYMPRGPMGEPLAAMPLLVRFADSAEEKARKQARKEQFATRLGRPSMEAPQLASFEDPRSAGAQLPNVPNGLPAGFEAFGASGLPDLGQKSASTSGLYGYDGQSTNAELEAMFGSLRLNNVSLDALSRRGTSLPLGLNSLKHLPITPGMPSSLYVKNLPPETDRLWLYERFAPHGAILSVKVLQEEQTGKCRGVGFVNFVEPQGALLAIQTLNGMKVSDKHLHVSLQSQRSRPQ